MLSEIQTMRGTVRGKTIELDQDVGVADGQEVEVELKVIRPKRVLPGPPAGWKSGMESATLGLLVDSWTDEDDRILEAIYQDRKRDRQWSNGE